jgi:Txe/YoeB family toxin of toxin-antitoxin system
VPFSSSQRLSANEGPKEKGVASGREFILLTTALMASSALAIDLMLPAFPKMREEYGMSPDSSQVSWIVTAFFLGLAVGPWLYGPASDKYGRRGLLFAGLALYSLGGILASVAPSWGWVIVARFIWGLGAAAARSLSTAMIRDRFEGTGKPEPLKGDLSGWRSRRIKGERRLVYRVDGSSKDQFLIVAQCRGRYDE